MRTKKKRLPEFLQGVNPEPVEWDEFQDAMSNLIRLVEYLRINEDLLTPYDYRVMMVVELGRPTPRPDILRRVYGKFNKSRRAKERAELGC